MIVVYLNYLVTDNLCTSSSFHHSTKHCNIAVKTILSLVLFQELNILQLESYSNLLKSYDVVRMLVWVATNCLLNNYSSWKEDQVTQSKIAKKRNLQLY